MNYLAHAYLSMGRSGIITGNLISDFVKGKKQYDFPIAIQQGIRLHRAIDLFTDRHPATNIIKDFFRPDYRLYSGAFTDVVYDFFLANDQTEFPETEEIQKLVIQSHLDLEVNQALLPTAFIPVYESMRTHNWLANFGFEWAIKKSFENMVRRSRYLTESEKAFAIFQKNISTMRDAYSTFFPDVKAHAGLMIEELLQQD